MSASARHSRGVTRQRSGMRVWLRRIRSGLIFLLVLTAIAYAGLQTPWAKQRLVTWLNAYLSTTDQQIQMEGLTGWLPQQARLNRLSMADRQGLWLQLQDVTLAWSPWQWFKGRLYINTIAAQRCQMLRLPSISELSFSQDLPSPIGLPAVIVERLYLAQLDLSPSITGKLRRLGVEVALRTTPDLKHVHADLAVTGDLALNAKLNLLDKKLSLVLNAEQSEAEMTCAYAIQDGRLDLADIEAAIPGAQLHGKASIDLSTGLIDGTAIVDMTDAAPFAALFGQPAQGQMKIKTTLHTTGERQDLHVETESANWVWSDLTVASLKGSADLTDVFKRPKGQAGFTGKDIRWQDHQLSHLSLNAYGDLEQGQMDVNTAGVLGRAFTLNHQAVWRRNAEDWQVTLKTGQVTYDRMRFYIKPLGSLTLQQSGTDPMTLGIQACELSAEGHTLPVAGTLQIALSSARLYGDLQLQGDLATQVKLDIALPIQRPQGHAQLELIRHDARIQCRGDYAMTESHLDLTDLTILTPGAEAFGQATIQLDRGLAVGSFQAKVTDATSLATFSSTPVQGQGQGLLTLSLEEKDQLIDMHWQMNDVQWTSLNMAALKGDGSLRINGKHVTGSASCIGQGMTWNQLHLDQFFLEAIGDDQALAMTMMSEGSLMQPLEVQTHAIVHLNETGPLLTLDHSQVQYGSQQLTLNKEATLWREVHNGSRIYTLQDWQWQTDNATLSVEGSFSPQSLNLEASLVNMNIGAWTENQDLSGTLDGSLTLSGSPRRPCIESAAHIHKLGLRNSNAATITYLDAEVTAQLTGQDLYTEADLSTVSGDHIVFQAQVPVSFSLTPWQWIVHDQDLQARFKTDVDLAVLDWLPVLHEAVLQGRIQADMGYAGSLAAGTLSGAAQWNNGYYEDIILGTVIPNIHATLTADNRQLRLSARTSDGKGAEQVTAQGAFKLSKSQDFPYAIQIQTDRFPWIQRPDINIIASGKIAITGSMKHVLLQGDLTTDQGFLDLSAMPSQPPPMITPPTQAAARVEPTLNPSPAPEWVIEGGLSLNLGNSFQITGRGLTSLWNGKLTLNRSSPNWNLTGNVSPYRGDFRLLGRVFRLTQGSIRLDGAWPADPILDLTAVHHRHGIEARIRITGRSSDPIVSIQSEPVLPEDAILATVLFGKDLSTITAMQAVQLAAALKDLHSPGGGIDLLRSTRRVLGVDYIDIQKPDERPDGLSLTVGKQLRSEIYVELQRSLDQQGVTSTHVEYEIRPNLTLETDAGSGIRPGLGLNWKKDY